VRVSKCGAGICGVIVWLKDPVNPATGKGDRVGYKFLEAQAGNAPRKVRFFKSNGEVVDV